MLRSDRSYAGFACLSTVGMQMAPMALQVETPMQMVPYPESPSFVPYYSEYGAGANFALPPSSSSASAALPQRGLTKVKE